MSEQSFAFRECLINIARGLNKEDFDALKHYFKETINSTKDLEKIVKPTDLFDTLEKRGALDCNNVKNLKSSLKIIKAESLYKIVEIYENEFIGNCHSKASNKINQEYSTIYNDNYVPEELPLKSERCFVAECLGRDWRHLGRYLTGITDNDIDCVADDYNGKLREQAHQMLKIWAKRQGSNATLKELLGALRSARLNLIADNLERRKV